MSKVLVTGFEPFGRRDKNMSQYTAELAGQANHVDSVILPVSFEYAGPMVLEQMQRDDYRTVLMLGEGAALLSGVAAEDVARNRSTAITMPDNYNSRRIGSIEPTGRPRLNATLDYNELLEGIENEGIRARRSRNAGRYVCNHSFYEVLHNSNNSVPVGFMHLNRLDEKDSDIVAASIVLNL